LILRATGNVAGNCGAHYTRAKSYNAHVYHVQLTRRGFLGDSSARYNLTEDEVQRDVVERWAAGEIIVAGGSAFDPSDSRITIFKGHVEQSELNKPSAWLVVSALAENVTDRFIKAAPGSRRRTSTDTEGPDLRRVAVVHGRDAEAQQWMFGFLRALDLLPIEWSEAIQATGSAAPSNNSAVEQLFNLARAVVVLFTPDEITRLHPDLMDESHRRLDGMARLQARPNVLLEAGMALALHPHRTILVELGAVDLPSDLHGLNTVRLTGAAQPLHEMAKRLFNAGCAVDMTRSDWLRTEAITRLGARSREQD
jgi:predicted nucleotide-binding protein